MAACMDYVHFGCKLGEKNFFLLLQKNVTLVWPYTDLDVS